MPSFLWLHGFASGPQSAKGRYLQARLYERGAALAIPDLNAPGFRDLTISRMLAQVERLVQDGPTVLFGSSLGGFVAATFASRHPQRVAALILLAPAFDLAARWEARMGAPEIARWRRDGATAFDHYATGRKELLSFAFLEDARRYPAFPLPRAQTLVLQGEHDGIVQPALAREFARRLSDQGTPVRLVLLPDGHELTADLPRLWAEMEPILSPWLPAPAAPATRR